MSTIAAVVCAYLIGSVSFAVLVSRVFGLADPRSYGSGNPGATNVLRSGRKLAAALTLLGDAGKGWLAVWLAGLLAPQGAATPTAAAGVAVIVGHMFPVFHGFKGGKGVATALGILVGFSPWLGLAALATWLAVVMLWRISSLAALVTAGLAPVYALGFFGPGALSAAVGAVALLLIYRHRSNIRNLLAGTEGRIGGPRTG